MKSISKLKDEARRHEQREEWEKAIQAYLQVLRTAEEGETEVELPLYNRVGDLCVRLGKPQEAVRHYEQAADRYAEAGLYNNAIALCNKALRYNPDRLELIRKLGQFSASQGFITDARRYFLDYAERQFKAGKVTEALGALEDFANVSDDAEVREMLGRQLHAHGRFNDAVDELRRAHAMRLREGNAAQAEALRAEILAIDPHAVVDPGATAPDARRTTPAELPGLVEIEPVPLIEPEVFEVEVSEAPGTEEVAGLETGALPGADGLDLPPVELDGFETADDTGLADIDLADGGIEGLETTTLDFGTVAGDAPALEDLGIERDGMSFGDSDRPADGEIFDLPTLDEPDAAFDLPTLDEAEPVFDLPLLDEPGDDMPLPALDEPDALLELPAPDDADAAGDLPAAETAFDTESFDLPLLGDDEPPPVEDEATPLVPPQIDDVSLPDLPEQAASDAFDLGGDLPLDLTSFGSGSYDLPPVDEDVEAPSQWTSDEPSFDLPAIDGEALGLPTWEPEPGNTFELPSFDTEDEPIEEIEIEPPEAVDLPEPRAESTAQPQETPADASGPAREAGIPAIELPTWEFETFTDADADAGEEWAAPAAEDAAGAEPEEPAFEADLETAEPTWLETTQQDEEEVSADLPTFTYEDDAEPVEMPELAAEADSRDLAADEEAAVEPVAREVESAARTDDDPLGLAAHLTGGVQSPDVDDVSARTDAKDWLDEIADDEPELAAEQPFDDAVALEIGNITADASGDTADVPIEDSIDDMAAAADVVEDAVADVEDVATGIARSEDAAREMAAAPPPANDYIDLGAFIAEGDGEDTTRFRVQETSPTGDEDRDFAELLSQFKSKVQEHLPPEDAAAHYDLGLAFKEMGLIDEAIGEFQIALRAGHMRLKVAEELGQCFLQKEQYNIAEKVLSRALELKFDDELELLGVYYHLGRAYEALGRRDQARDAYERVLGMDINFEDVTDRLARL